MLDWKEPLPLDAIVDRGLVVFNATLSRAVGFAVLAGIAINLIGEQMFGPHEAELEALAREGRLLDLVERFGASLAGIAVLLLLVNSAVLHLVGTLARERPADPLSSLGVTLRKLPQLLIGGVLYFVALWCGLMLLLLPGLWVAVAMSFFVQAVLFDDHDGVRALGASLRLTRGHWWRTFALYLLTFVAMLIAMLIAGLLVGLVGGVTAFITGARQPLLELAVGALIGAILGLLIDGVVVAYYYDLKLRLGEAPRRADDSMIA